MCQLQIHFCPIYWFYVLLSCHWIILAVSWSRWTAMTEERSDWPRQCKVGTEKTGKGDPLKMINMYCSVLVLNCGAGYLEDFLDSSEQCGQTPGPAQSDSEEDWWVGEEQCFRDEGVQAEDGEGDWVGGGWWLHQWPEEKFDFTNPHHAALTEIWQSHNVDIMEMLEKYVNICFEKFLASGEVCVWFGEVLIKRSTEDWGEGGDVHGEVDKILNRPAQWMKRTYFYWGVQNRPGSWREK